MKLYENCFAFPQPSHNLEFNAEIILIRINGP